MAAPTSSEFALFQKLANPQKTDFSKPTAFRAAVQQHLQQPPMPSMGYGEVRSSTRTRSNSSRSSRSSSRSRSSRSTRSTRSSRGRGHHGDEYAGTGGAATHGGDYEPGSDVPFFGNFAQPPVNPAIDAQLHAEIEREKQGYLLELTKFKDDGIELTRDYTMDDALVDIQFEYDRIKTHLETKTNVAFVSDLLMFGFQGIEMANQKWGPILELNGWAASVQEDKPKYNRVVERLYKKHWRYGSMSPEAEFAWLVGSSMVKHHLKNKWGLRTDGGSGDGGHGNGNSGGGLGNMFNTLSGAMRFMPGAAAASASVAAPRPPFPNMQPPVVGGNGAAAAGRPIMTRPNVRHFATPPPMPPVAVPDAPHVSAPVAAPVDASDGKDAQELREAKAALIKLEQQKEAERELRNELRVSREQMQQMQQHMHQQALQAREEASRQQAAHQQQMERMQTQFSQAMMHVQRQQVQQVQQVQVQPHVVQPQVLQGPPLPDSSSSEEEVAFSSDDESDREISIIGKANVLTQVPRRATKVPPSALKLDL